MTRHQTARDHLQQTQSGGRDLAFTSETREWFAELSWDLLYVGAINYSNSTVWVLSVSANTTHIRT